MSISILKAIDEICERFEDCLLRDSATQLEDFVTPSWHGDNRAELIRQLLRIEVEVQLARGNAPSADSLKLRFADYPGIVESVLKLKPAFEPTLSEFSAMPGPDDQELLESDRVRNHEANIAAPVAPQGFIGRYRVVSLLGEGGNGQVFLAQDEELNRAVAVKVPRPGRAMQPEDRDAYLKEARTAASLDHANIVPIYDVGSTSDGMCYVVFKVIHGTDLANKLKQSRFSFAEAAQLLATVAEALHYAHLQGLVHRDIKPANILIDAAGEPFVTDFGLALKEEDFDSGPDFVGTPAYMSPEQARGEGHRVDGRSDIFSLGVICYELLVGRRPFQSQSTHEVLKQITGIEPRPLRQCDDRIPKELERICLKAMAKRASERYTTAKDMADDLRQFLTEHLKIASPPEISPSTILAGPPLRSSRTETSTSKPSLSNSIKIVPKGLRSFDLHDADFFLELLPGPRDRDGLPECLRFWMTRIEDSHTEQTFSVGLIYGPSGCGKSSLVKAGLLPRLSAGVITVYVETDADDTETRLLNNLRKRCPTLPPQLDLKTTLAALRHGQYLPKGKKVLIVLDQFEQWLNAHQDKESTSLVEALRQCDEQHVQCIVMVRDDFWMAATRFMRELEVRLVEGQNSAAVDLFPLRHSEKVLVAFGRAFGTIPESSHDVTREQTQFIEQSIQEMSEGGKVISVRLSLFAEMMKDKAWTPATLKSVGGVAGLGATYLDETLSSATAPVERRYHQHAIRELLRALLPAPESDIKGNMRSYAELLHVSGYGNRPKDFDAVLRLLDREIRLITPVERGCPDDDSVTAPVNREQYFQLTHDYLVPSLRDWLTRKQKETRRGRAELLLADRAVVWNTRPERRHLPSLAQSLSILLFVPWQTWTPPQRKMMRTASRFRALQVAILAATLVIAGVAGWAVREQRMEDQRQATERQNLIHAAGLVEAVVHATTHQVPVIVLKMNDYRRWVDPLLRQEFDKSEINSSQKLNVSLALLPVDAGQVSFLFSQLLDAKSSDVAVICEALAPYRNELLEKLWIAVTTSDKGQEHQRLRAAAALSSYAADDERWSAIGTIVVDDLVNENPIFLGHWSDLYRPVRQQLHSALSSYFRDHQVERLTQRNLATNLLIDYASDRPDLLLDLLLDADEQQFLVIFPKLRSHAQLVLPLLFGAIQETLPNDVPAADSRRESLAKRQANAAVALLRLRQSERVWPLLEYRPDPRVRSHLIHRIGPFGADVLTIVERLENEPDITKLRALWMSLGEFDEGAISPEMRQTLLPRLQATFRTHVDPGLHAAAEWLLRKWQQDDWLKQSTDELKTEPRLADIEQQLMRSRTPSVLPPQWCVNSRGQTLIVIAGPVEFVMGSPASEAQRADSEIQHKRRIDRTFAIADRLVTWDEFLQFSEKVFANC